jgi:hypothetical protein
MTLYVNMCLNVFLMYDELAVFSDFFCTRSFFFALQMFVPELGGGVAPNPHFAAVRANAIATMDHLTSDSTTPTHGSSTRSLRFAPPSTVADAFAAAMPPLPAFPTTSDVLASATAEAAAAAAAAKIATESALSADLDSDQYDVDLGPSAIGDTDLPWNSASNTSVADRAARRRASPPHIGIVHTLPLLASDQITGYFTKWLLRAASTGTTCARLDYLLITPRSYSSFFL